MVLLQEVPCTFEGPYLYLAETTQVSALIYLASAANCCAAAMDTRDVQVSGVDRLVAWSTARTFPAASARYWLPSARRYCQLRSSRYRRAEPTALDLVSVSAFSCKSRARRAADTLPRGALRSLRRSPWPARPTRRPGRPLRGCGPQQATGARRQESRRCRRAAIGQARAFPMRSALLRIELVNSGAVSAQFFTRRRGCDYRPSLRLLLQTAACRLSRAFKRRLRSSRLLSPGRAFMRQRAGMGLPT